MKVTVGGVAKTIGGDIWGLTKELPGYAADKASGIFGVAKKRATKAGQRANGIYRVTQSTCEDRFMVMAETMLPAAGKALWLLLVPRPSEILEEAIQPKGKRTDPRTRTRRRTRNRKGKNGKRRKRFRGIVPNTNTLVAGIIPGSFARASRVPGPVEGAAWWAWDRAELVLYWWLILEAWDTFIYEWSSGIVEARFCENRAQLLFEGEGFHAGISNTELWDNASEVTVNQLKGLSVSNDGVITVDSGGNVSTLTMNMTVSGEIKGPDGGDKDILIKARIHRRTTWPYWDIVAYQNITIPWSPDDRGTKHYEINLTGTANGGDVFQYFLDTDAAAGPYRRNETWKAMAIGDLA